ncbi:CBS domain-containing protein [Amycolatopsis pithecellobii]|uniref:CBS domain-containing protein n=1 Tax=Amycolatopsis pithecellobii TaxID=664692 RepID=A0A6N7ZBW2_9PSEU|nr:CBS domain-containing protein [Amycolatopsis pithecellobii]MTD59196.1 CBS domain-containing protein [Amycolatopsis pithecellobii]
MRTREIMSSPVYGITADAGIEEAAALMVQRGYTTLPVITGDGTLLGLITEENLARTRFTPGARGEATPDSGAVVGLAPANVRQLVHTPVPTVTADTELTEVATAMVESGRRCLPVVDAENHVVGIISWRDVLRQLLPQT